MLDETKSMIIGIVYYSRNCWIGRNHRRSYRHTLVFARGKRAVTLRCYEQGVKRAHAIVDGSVVKNMQSKGQPVTTDKQTLIDVLKPDNQQ
jgi:hypothetical protein